MEAKNSNKGKQLIITLVAMALTGCGKMKPMAENSEKTRVCLPVESVLFNALGKGMISLEEADQIKETLMKKSITLIEEKPRALQMKLADMNVLVEFRENVTKNPQDVAFTMNGVEVTNEMISDPEALEYLIASVSSSKPSEEGETQQASQHLEAGQKLVTGNTTKRVASNLLSLVIRTGLGFLALSNPVGALISGVATPILMEYENRKQQRPPHEQGWSQNNGSNPNPSGRNQGMFYETEQDSRERMTRSTRNLLERTAQDIRERINQFTQDQPNRNSYDQFSETGQDSRERMTRSTQNQLNRME